MTGDRITRAWQQGDAAEGPKIAPGPSNGEAAVDEDGETAGDEGEVGVLPHDSRGHALRAIGAGHFVTHSCTQDGWDTRCQVCSELTGSEPEKVALRAVLEPTSGGLQRVRPRRSCKPFRDTKQVLLCDGCDDEVHMHCCVPPFTQVPEGDFFCMKCEEVQCRPAWALCSVPLCALTVHTHCRQDELWLCASLKFALP